MPTGRVEYTRSISGGAPMHQVDRRLPSGFLPASYWPEDAAGNKRVKRGVILAQVEGGLEESEMTGSQVYYVPYSASAAYGVGSDTAAGILERDVDATFSDWVVNPAYSGIAFEKYCYEPGGPIGSITAAVKADLSNIDWR